ncbi:MAG: hypothetical protein E7277_04975 [Lachnospiraceae bacterium]|nr:hypothetical protein [Lachnospiraceae bacterium]
MISRVSSDIWNQKREDNVYNSIYNRMRGGRRLTLGEEDKLRERNLKVYMEYKADVEEQKAYEERLRHCKSKEEAQRMHMNKVQTNLNELRKIINDPCISKQKKVNQAQRIQGATTTAIQTFHEFVQGDAYTKMPKEQEMLRMESIITRDAGNVAEDFVLSGYRNEEASSKPGLKQIFEKEDAVMQEIRKMHSKEAGTEVGLEVDVLV